jgi:hypothetical protein
MLRRGGSAGMINIQLLVMKLLLHSPSSLDYEEGKQYHEKMQFTHSIIQNIYRSKPFAIEFLRR